MSSLPPDDSFDGIRYIGMECEDAIVTGESGSDYGDDTEKEKEIWGIDLNEEEGVYVNDDGEDDNVTIPLCWDSLQLENLGTNNELFEWEEVNDGGSDEIAEEEATNRFRYLSLLQSHGCEQVSDGLWTATMSPFDKFVDVRVASSSSNVTLQVS